MEEPASVTAATALTAALAFLALAGLAAVIAFACVGRLVRPLHLAIGWATTVAMWAIGYFCMMGPGLVVGEALAALELAVIVFGGFLAARLTREARSGAVVGTVSAVANLLVVGSLFGKGTDDSLLPTAAAWVIGLFGVSGALGWLGGMLGAHRPRPDTSDDPLELFSRVATKTVFLLLITGGLVTGLQAGLAVPDWPNSFGHNMLLYPLAQMKEGVYYEHAHRLFGSLVGLTTIVLVAMVWRLDTRRWTRVLSVALLLAVVVQGLMGALRVTGTFTLSTDRAVLIPSSAWGVVHAVFGQVVFASFCAMLCAQSPRWRSNEPAAAVASGAKDIRWTTILLPVMLVQLIIGALYRQLSVPDAAGVPQHPVWAIHAHITMALIVLGIGGHAVMRALRQPPQREVIRRYGGLFGLLLLVQVMLGFTAWMLMLARKTPEPPVSEVIFTTAHQAIGAMLLGMATAMAFWMRRLVRPSTAA